MCVCVCACVCVCVHISPDIMVRQCCAAPKRDEKENRERACVLGRAGGKKKTKQSENMSERQ